MAGLSPVGNTGNMTVDTSKLSSANTLSAAPAGTDQAAVTAHVTVVPEVQSETTVGLYLTHYDPTARAQTGVQFPGSFPCAHWEAQDEQLVVDRGGQNPTFNALFAVVTPAPALGLPVVTAPVLLPVPPAVSGRVTYSAVNAGSPGSDAGMPGVEVYLDLNGNG